MFGEERGGLKRGVLSFARTDDNKRLTGLYLEPREL